jgi:mannose-1-phosphate guanylyltransferase/mannose-6-phosphate isomerase
MSTIVILCGGNGTRLFPLSRTKLPKQFLDLTNSGKTMFQLVCLRAFKLKPDKLIFICNCEHVFLVEQQFKNINININIDYLIISEPFIKNTAPAIACACLQSNVDSNILVMPSDHIFNDDEFINCVNEGISLTNQGIVTFGVVPTYPETGYGYIKYENDNIIEFVEKPNKETAEKYLSKKIYLWNSGVFLFNNNLMINEFNAHAPDILNNINITIQKSTINNNILNLDKDTFINVKNESIDYAIMEHHLNGKVILYNDRWNDLGTFESLYNYLPKDSNNNYLDGDIRSIDTHDCLIQSEKGLITTIGLDNLIIVSTRDTLLIANKDRTQDVKTIVNQLNVEKRPETIIHCKAFRPWGYYINIEGDDYTGFKVKRIAVYPHKRLSLQYHHKRSEHWVIVKGIAKVQVGEDQLILHKNQSVYIPIGVKHRIENIGDELVEFIETQIGEYLGEDDIIRIDDDFGRI